MLSVFPRRFPHSAAVLLVLPLLVLPCLVPPPTLAAPAPPAPNPFFAFLPAQAPLPAEKPDPPLTTADFTSDAPIPDVTGPSQAISQAWRQALAGLTSGKAAPYKAVLDAGYTQTAPQGSAIGLAETARRVDALLAGYEVSTAEFGLTACRMTGPDAATVTVRERLGAFTRNTPPTRVKTANGKTILMNNTTRIDTLLVLRQDWVRHGTVWTLTRSRMPQMTAAAVL